MPHQRPPPRHLSCFQKAPHLPQTKDVDIHAPPSILAQLLRGAASRPASTPPPPSSALPPPSSRAAPSRTQRPLRSISAASDPPRRPTAGAASTCAAATLTAAQRRQRERPPPHAARMAPELRCGVHVRKRYQSYEPRSVTSIVIWLLVTEFRFTPTKTAEVWDYYLLNTRLLNQHLQSVLPCSISICNLCFLAAVN